MIHYAVINPQGDLEFEFQGQQRAFCKRLGVGACVDVEIREHREKRSDRQNKAMWALLHEWCEQADQGWRPDDLKEAVLGEVFGRIEVTMPLSGEIRTVPAKPHSSKLSVSEFIQVIDAILELAAGQDIWLMAPDEYRKAKEEQGRRAKAEGQATRLAKATAAA